MTTTARRPVQPSARNPRPNASPWLWLTLGAVLLPFTAVQRVIPVAAFLAPIFLLRFVRLARARVALPVVAVVGYLGAVVSLWGIWPAPSVFIWAAPGLAAALVYGADKLAAPRLPAIVGTLVFPAADTALGYLGSFDRSAAFSSWGTPGYTQVNNLPLTQIASIVGVWGLSFLIMWTAAVVNHIWENGPEAARTARRVWATIVVATLLFGGAHLVTAPSDPTTVRVAALGPDLILDERRDEAPYELGDTEGGRARVAAEYLTPVIDELFDRTRSAAEGGARLVAWSEAAAFVYEQDRAALLEQARRVADDEGIYLEIGVVSILPTSTFPTNLNQSILFGPDGAKLWEYDKSSVVPGDGNDPGPGLLPIVQTPFGKLSVAICYDADFPGLIQQAGKNGVDILMVPSSDWKPIAPVHADMAVLRAVENGVSVVRPTRRGITTVVDAQGRMLAQDPDPFVGRDAGVIADVPTDRRPTVYPLVGDVVAQLSMAGLIVMVGCAAVRVRRNRRTTTPSAR